MSVQIEGIFNVDIFYFQSFNLKYVQIVEERLNEALTTYESTYDGSYVRRSNRRYEVSLVQQWQFIWCLSFILTGGSSH